MDLRSKKVVGQSKKHSQHSNFMVIVICHGATLFNKKLQIPSDCKDLAFEHPWPFLLYSGEEQLLSPTATLLDVFFPPVRIMNVKNGNMGENETKCIEKKLEMVFTSYAFGIVCVFYNPGP